jgi:hypothetical protein
MKLRLNFSPKFPNFDPILFLVQFFCSLAVKVGKLAQDWFHSAVCGWVSKISFAAATAAW